MPVCFDYTRFWIASRDAIGLRVVLEQFLRNGNRLGEGPHFSVHTGDQVRDTSLAIFFYPLLLYR